MAGSPRGGPWPPSSAAAAPSPSLSSSGSRAAERHQASGGNASAPLSPLSQASSAPLGPARSSVSRPHPFGRHLSSSSQSQCASSPLYAAAEDSCRVYLQPDHQQQFLLQGRLVDDTIGPRSTRSFFSLVSSATGVGPSSPSSPSGLFAVGSGAALHSPAASASLSFAPCNASHASLEGAGAPASSPFVGTAAGGLASFMSSLTSSTSGKVSAGGAAAGERVLSRSVEKVIESGDVKMEDIEPEQAADISKALFLHQKNHHVLLQSEMIPRTPLAIHPLSPMWDQAAMPGARQKDGREDGAASRPVSAERGTRTLNIIREVYQGHQHPSPAAAAADGGAARKGGEGEKAAVGAAHAGEAATDAHGEERKLASRRTRSESVSRESLQQPEGAEARGTVEKKRARAAGCLSSLVAGKPDDGGLPGGRGERSQLSAVEGRGGEPEMLLFPSNEAEEAWILDEIEARLKEDAEWYLESTKSELQELRINAEREVLALQYIPLKADRLLALDTSCRESLLGVFVCLCLRHIESASPEIQSLLAEWSLIFLHTLASPQVLNVDGSVEKSLVRPIVLRDQLLKDGLTASDILSPVPLMKVVVQACDKLQPEFNSIFNTLHAEMSCFAHRTSSPQDSPSSASLSSSFPCDGKAAASSALHSDSVSASTAAPSDACASSRGPASSRGGQGSLDSELQTSRPGHGRRRNPSPPVAPHARYARERQGILDESEEEGGQRRRGSADSGDGGKRRGNRAERGAYAPASDCTYTADGDAQAGRGSGAAVSLRAERRGVDDGGSLHHGSPGECGEDAARRSDSLGGRTSDGRSSSGEGEEEEKVSERLRRRLDAERRKEEAERKRLETSIVCARARGLGSLDGDADVSSESGKRENGLGSARWLPCDSACLQRVETRGAGEDQATQAPPWQVSSSGSDSHPLRFTCVAAHPLAAGQSRPPCRGRPSETCDSSLRVCLEKRREEDDEDAAGLVVAVGSVEEQEEDIQEDGEDGSSCGDEGFSLAEQRILLHTEEELHRYQARASGRLSGLQGRDDGSFSAAAGSGDDEEASSLMPSLPPSAKTVLLRELTTALVTSGAFDARVQLMLQLFAVEMLGLNPLILIRLQHHLAADLLGLLRASTKEGSRQKAWRRLKIAGAALGGGFLVALTAGLAAPGIVAGLASLGLGGAGVSAFLASAGGMAVMVSLFGAGGAGLTGWKYSRRIANIKVFEFDMLNGKTPASLGVTVCVSGYLRTFDDISLPWLQACPLACSDLFSLKWEPKILKALGGMVVQMLSQDFAVAAGKYYLQHTVLGGLTFALFWPMALIQYAANLDNTWILCRERAQQAGRLLADAISDTQAVGQRPVSLVGYSMGARVVFYCLQTLWKRRKLHVVCDCVLIGLPASLNAKQWSAARDVVSRRLVNVYSRSDWLLAFLYRWMEWGLQVAGLSPVKCVPGVENYDVTGLVKSHAQYPEKIPDILSFIGFDA